MVLVNWVHEISNSTLILISFQSAPPCFTDAAIFPQLSYRLSPVTPERKTQFI